MGTHSQGMHHYQIRKRIHEKHEPYPHPDRLKRFIDKIIYLVAVLGPAMIIPQLIKIWLYQDAGGVSLLTWAGFAFFSIIWLIYGFLHKEKPIIFMNTLLLIFQIMVASGVLIYGSGF